MSYLDMFNERNQASGNSIREQKINDSKVLWGSSFSDSPSYFQVLINSSPTGVQIVDDSKVKDQKEITSLDYQLKNGDIIEWQNGKWLNILTDNMSDIYYRGTLNRVVGQLKWLTEEGILKQQYFTFKNDPATNFGIDYGRIINTGNERRTLILSSDNETKLISKDKRFIFDSRAWKVTAVDTISVGGLIVLTVDEDQINKTSDNLDLSVADYYGKVANFAVTIMGGDNVSIRAGKTLQLESKVTNNGVVITNKKVHYNSSNPSIASVGSNGLVTTLANGEVYITAALVDYPDVYDSQFIKVEFSTGTNLSVKILENPVVTIGTPKTFTIQVLNNSVIDVSKFVAWGLYAEDKVSNTNLAQMTFNSTTQCTLKGLSDGYVQLKVVVIGTSQPNWIRVQIKGLY